MAGSRMEELYRSYYRYAFSIAYRMLGTVADAEDAVQDCFAELQRREPGGIQNMKAYVAKGITNRCLNMLGSARSRRETYVGEWLPEPVSEADDGPEASAERKDTLSYAFLVLLERLTPTERAVFVLREAFQYEYDAIAEMVGKSESNCRQIFSRAKRTLQARPSSALQPAAGNDASREQLLRRFTEAFTAYDVGGMLELLAEQPVLIGDGGGQEVHTILRPMAGRKGVLALLTSRRVLKQMREWEIAMDWINGEQNLVFKQQGVVRAVLCLALDKSGEQIQELYLMMAASKLGHVTP
ncbi:RNA polymerase subunit sigma [Paenibacillus sp. P3E]|uniref:sigma-70 family RNA polymerase sigma factor n=1 Tax=unclassified Paenibacillus TaxID=185978 RepID=UPI00094038E8|nr:MULTISPECIES: sigma-70 family RNA polymerase sigma factor [unclassified Paenibacillus]OKP82448.1 RNA polymerase subunit sigma [Paenibacillus sp. P3E]OKP84614.1 RNA polymerase subunit sigma [Paenibacillus sp. P32E]